MADPVFAFDAYGTLYDVRSVSAALEQAYPGKASLIAQVWRQKQLEYTWLRTSMGRFRDFAAVTEEALSFALQALELGTGPSTVADLCLAWRHLTPYPEAATALAALAPRRRVILSNGSQAMLDDLVRNSGLGHLLQGVISVDPARAFKPSPKAYELVEERLDVDTRDVVFVSANPFDVTGAKQFGFRVAWIDRLGAAALRAHLAAEPPSADALFNLLRTRPESLGVRPDWRVATLGEIASLGL